MFTVFVLGNIASGKSTACRYLESHGAMLIDLDELAKSLYVPGSDIVNALAEEFGWDILDEEGGIRRSILASRAFASPDSVARLNGLVQILVISAPLSVRRERAIQRGMEPSDFDARSACQPDESALCNLATTVIDNAAGDNSLFEQLDSWLACHGFIDTANKEDADA